MSVAKSKGTYFVLCCKLLGSDLDSGWGSPEHVVVLTSDHRSKFGLFSLILIVHELHQEFQSKV